MSQSTKLPDIGRMTDQLAAQNVRVSSFIDSLPRHVDSLVEAGKQGDWVEVRRISGFLALMGGEVGCPNIAEAARAMCDEADRPNNELNIKRSLIRLISRCGKERKCETAAPTS